MKKILILFFIIVFVAAGCSDDSSENNSENGKKQSSETANNNQNEEVELHGIGDTVQVKNHEYGFTYEVTLNSYKEQDEFEGKTVADFTADDADITGVKLAVMNVTIKNTSEQSFILLDKTEPIFLNSQPLGFYNELTPELKESLESGEEITVNLVSATTFDESNRYLVFEFMKDEEVRFELKTVEG